MRIGIIGAGQLGQMLGIAARQLGHECRFLDPATSPPAANVGDVCQAPFDDLDALTNLADECDVVTYEFENVPVEALATIADTVAVYPPLNALRQAQDRLTEKQLFEALHIPLPPYWPIGARADLDDAVATLGLPVVVKTRRFGYDGKGQFVIHAESELDAVWQSLDGREAIAESWVDFDAEVSAIGARTAQGDVAVWPLTQNEHVDGILRSSRAPIDDARLAASAEDHMRRLLERLNYVGVLALELFVVNGRLLANEFAPRVHNSGHWTIEGAETSQFSNHLRAIAGQTLGRTTARGYAGMANLIGSIPTPAREISLPGSYIHDYGKSPRPGRKLGHITVIADTAAERDARLAEILETVT